jgi:hypothetical protein
MIKSAHWNNFRGTLQDAETLVSQYIQRQDAKEGHKIDS